MQFRIKEYRKSRKMSQDELAKHSGVSRATISLLENGKCDDVMLGTLDSIANALDVSLRSLII